MYYYSNIFKNFCGAKKNEEEEEKAKVDKRRQHSPPINHTIQAGIV